MIRGRRRRKLPLTTRSSSFARRTSNTRGRLVRLGQTLDAIIAPHKMPDAASKALSEALTLAALCGSALPAEGNLNLQTRSNGAVSILVADYAGAGRLRGYARYDKAKLAEREQLKNPNGGGGILGDGHLAITLDPGPGEERYQGVLAFEGAPLAATAAAYFEQREALPTFIRLAVARHYIGARQAASSEQRWHWRAGGLMVQSLSAGSLDDDDRCRGRLAAGSNACCDRRRPRAFGSGSDGGAPAVRLFHEEAVAIERVIPLSKFCRCSREKVENVLLAFGAAELSDMRDDNGKIVVTCEFCATRYTFSLDELRARS